MKTDYLLVENMLTASDFLNFKVSTGFRARPIEQIEQALANDLLDVVAIVDGNKVGMGRLVGDGVLYWYLQEIIVLPEYQGQGIGTGIVNYLLDHIKAYTAPGTFTSVGLTAAEGKSSFYERFGFQNSRGMNLYVER